MTVRVLIVEDDAKFRAAFADAVASAPDMQLLGAAANGRQGIDLLDRHAPDVLLVDLGLPDVDGLEVIRHAASTLPDCDVMVVTVFGDERHVLESIETGATGYLLKDSMPEDFIEQIRLLRAGGSPISPIIARQLLARFQRLGSGGGGPRTGSEPASAVPAAVVAGNDARTAAHAGANAVDEAGTGDDRPELSERERSVLGLVTKGFTYDEIAGLLGVSRNTVTTYVRRIYRKLQVGSKTEAVYEARKLGLLRD